MFAGAVIVADDAELMTTFELLLLVHPPRVTETAIWTGVVLPTLTTMAFVP